MLQYIYRKGKIIALLSSQGGGRAEEKEEVRFGMARGEWWVER